MRGISYCQAVIAIVNGLFQVTLIPALICRNYTLQNHVRLATLHHASLAGHADLIWRMQVSV